MITINLYDYKTVVRNVGIQRNISLVAASTMLVGLLCLGVFFLQLALIANVNSELEEVNQKVAQAKPDYDAVQLMKAKQTRYNEIITGIGALRGQQAPTTQLLEDVGQILPQGVWLKEVKQLDMKTVHGRKIPFLFIDYSKNAPPPAPVEGAPQDVFIKIGGSAMNDQPIIHFLDQLRAFPYFDAVVLHKSTRDYVDVTPIQNFEIYCHFLKPEPEKS